ncbi:uncharacterized protein LOC122499314 [Leptopilina heterotoma]|uniref:uncharacterized protein LOC122499314 n=1 Tax=Leptopilina heterotoma TaxID=63436 RepID=UPI001CA84B8A|nr:uncharacterized protein LOC122499314 [Leptopilina heterotoma]
MSVVVTVNRRGVLIFLVVSMICMMAADPIQTSKLTNNNDIDDNESNGNELQSRKHKYHLLPRHCGFSSAYLYPSFLSLLGGLKGWIALLLIKFKIVIVSFTVAAIVIATLKFVEVFKYRTTPYSSPHYIAHEPAYDFGSPIHLDHSSHDRYGNDWSSSNSYSQRISTKTHKPTKFTGGKRSSTQKRR